jgi:hypothetical protein
VATAIAALAAEITMCTSLCRFLRNGLFDARLFSEGEAMAKKRTNKAIVSVADTYHGLVSGITDLLEQARGATVRAVNGILTAT